MKLSPTGRGCWAFVLTKVVPAGQPGPLSLRGFKVVGMV